MVKLSQITSMLLAGVTLMTALPIHALAAIGDLNKDNEIDKKDAELFSQYFAGWDVIENEIDWDAADFNRDGSITREDAMRLARYTDGWEDYSVPEDSESENNFRISEFNVDKDTAVVGSIFEWTAEAAGGEGQVSYSFELKKLEDAATYAAESSGTIVASQDYGPENYFCVNVSEAGNYAVTISCKDASDTVCTLQNVCPVVVTNTELEKITVVSDTGKSVCQGETLTWNVKTFGGNVPFTYQYSLLCDQNEIDFITSEESVYTYENCQPGEYQLMVRCTDADGVRKTVLSDAVRVYTAAEYSPAAPEVRVAGDVVVLSESMEDTNSVEAQSLLLEWDVVSSAKQYFVELAYRTANDWYIVDTGESITANRYTLSENLFRTAAAERLYRIGVYSRGIAAGEMQYYYFRVTPVVVDESILVEEKTSLAWDTAAAKQVTRKFNVTSELDWTVSSNVSWITCTKGEDGFLTVVDSNTGSSNRSGTITVSNGVNSIAVTVRQGYGDGAPELLYPLLSSDPSAPTVRPSGGIKIGFEEKKARYVGIRMYELADNGKREVVYENVLSKTEDYLYITESDISDQIDPNGIYVLELSERYSTEYAVKEVEDEVEKALFYIQMVPDGHEILIEGVENYDCVVRDDCPIESYIKIDLYSTNPWNCTSDVDWLHPETYDSLTDRGEIEIIQIDLDPNYSENDRVGTLTFICGDAEAKITVTQSSYLPRIEYPALSKNSSSPTTLPISGMMFSICCQNFTYAAYKNGAWGEEEEWYSTTGDVRFVREIWIDLPEEYFESNVLYRFTLTTGDYTTCYYVKFSSTTQKFIALKHSITSDEVKEMTWNVSSGASAHTVEMLANASWKISSSASWLTVSSTSGSSLSKWKKITVTTKANTTGKERTGVLSFKLGTTVYATLTINQGTEDSLTVFVEDPSFIYSRWLTDTYWDIMEGTGDSLTLYAWTEDCWNVKSNNSWILVDDQSSVDNIASGNDATISVTRNTGDGIRTGSFTVTAGHNSRTFYIKQAPALGDFTLISPSLSTSSSTPSSLVYGDMTLKWKAVDHAEKYTIYVNPSDRSLCNDGILSYQTTIIDDGSSMFSCVVPQSALTLNGTSYDKMHIYSYDAYGDSTTEIYYFYSTLGEAVRLDGTMTPVWENATDIATSRTFAVTSTSDWTARSKTSWISIDRTSGSDGDTLTVSLEANSGAARSGQVTVSVGNTDITLTVNQCAYLPKFPELISPQYSDDMDNPTVIPASTTSIKATWDPAPQAEYYQVELLSYETDNKRVSIEESAFFRKGESEYEFTDLELTPGHLYMLSILQSSHWGYTCNYYYFTPSIENAWVLADGESCLELELDPDEDCVSVEIESNGLWIASTDVDWIMLDNRRITQEVLDEEGYTSSSFNAYSDYSGESVYISVLPNPGNTYRYGTVTVRCGDAEAILMVAQEPYYEIAEIYSPVLAERRQDSVGLPYGNVTVRWNACVGGAGTYQIILEERKEDSTYRYYDILEESDITATSYTIPASKLTEGGYYCLKLYSDLVDTDESLGKSYYFYIKYENELSVSADVDWNMNEKVVKISSSATGGAGGYQFAYELLLDGEQVTISMTDDLDYYTFPLTEAGTYQVRVYCVDEEGFSTEFLSGTYTYGSTVYDSVSLSHTSWNTSAWGGSVSVTVSSNGVWNINSCPDWISCSKTTGNNGESVVLSADENTSTERTGYVTFSSGGAQAMISILQDSAVLRTSITYPREDAVIELSDLIVKWRRVAEVDSYLFALRDLTTDILLVQGVSTVNTSYTIPSSSLANNHDYRIAVGVVVGTQIWWTEGTFSIAAPTVEDDASDSGEIPVVHDYSRVTLKTELINQTLDVHDVVTTYYETCSICGDTTSQKTDTVTVEHNFTYVGYEATHPHAKFQRCACGASPYIDGEYKTANGSVQEKSDCCICHSHKYDTANPSKKNGKWYVDCLKCGISKNVDAPASNTPAGCTHPKGFIMGKTVHNGQIYMNVDSPYIHNCHNTSYTVYCCSECGKTDWSTVDYFNNQGKEEGPHTFNEDAVCSLCGYVSLNGIYDYTEQYELSIGTKYYLEDNIYVGIGESLSILIYDHFTGKYDIPSRISNITLSLKDPNGIGKIEGNTFVASNSGSCELVLSYFGKQVDTVPIGVTLLSAEDKFFTYKILETTNGVRLDDLMKVEWWRANVLITPSVAMGNFLSIQNNDGSHTISFEVYNSSAEVLGFAAYNERGNRVNDEIELIDSYWATGSIIGEAFDTVFLKKRQLFNLKQNDDLHTQKSKIELTVPEGGYIQLLDMSEDMTVLSANIGEFIIGSIKLADDVEGLINPADTKILQEALKAVGKEKILEIICKYMLDTYGDSPKQFLKAFLKENRYDIATDLLDIVKTLLIKGMQEDLIGELIITLHALGLDELEDALLQLFPGMYLLKHGRQTLYDFGAMAQLAAAYNRCGRDVSEKYISHILTPHRNAKEIVIDYDKLLDNTSRTVITTRDTVLRSSYSADYQEVGSVPKGTELQLIGSITSSDDGNLYYQILYNNMTVYVPATDIKLR